jgi:type II secretory pathway component PulL
MTIRSKNWIIILSVFLSFSLLLPLCCHSDVSQWFGQHQEAQSNVDYSLYLDYMPECNCGHELVKDFKKSFKSFSSTELISAVSAVIATQPTPAVTSNGLLTPILIPPALLDDASPPVHLLISVFIN